MKHQLAADLLIEEEAKSNHLRVLQGRAVVRGRRNLLPGFALQLLFRTHERAVWAFDVPTQVSRPRRRREHAVDTQMIARQKGRG
jgi:hypothetical protein